ncbi:MAG: glycosyltransferase [Caulobacterales bacterium]
MSKGSQPKRVMLIWWGRRGGLAPLTAAVAQAAAARPDIELSLSLSADSAALPLLAPLADRIDLVPAIRRPLDALRPDLILAARRAFAASLAARRPERAIVLMPHVWTRFTTDLFARVGTRWACIIHDAEPHPGDATAAALGWINGAARSADRVIALSEGVARHPAVARLAPVAALFHPVLTPTGLIARAPAPDGALRVLFFGRLFAYRGLEITVDAVERLRAAGRSVRLGVFGEGDLSALAPRLAALGAEVENRWIEEGETAGILARHDLMALSHLEASQSGAAALALGAGLPAIVTPIGALPEQIGFGRAGVVAEAATGAAFAAALERIFTEPGLLNSMRAGAGELARERSAAAFLERALEDLG